MKSEEYGRVTKAIMTLAEKGSSAAQKSLGERYYFGIGVTKDYVEAVKWFRRAAEQRETSKPSRGLDIVTNLAPAQFRMTPKL